MTGQPEQAPQAAAQATPQAAPVQAAAQAPVQAAAQALQVLPSRLSGRVEVPPSKSMGHRALIAAALAAGTEGLRDVRGASPDTSRDIRATWNALVRMVPEGVAALRSGHRTREGSEPASPGGRIECDCDESGSTLRFLVPLAAALGLSVDFTGRGRLPLRPLDAYFQLFADKGVTLSAPPGRSLPLQVSGTLRPGVFELPGDISSQYVSGLLMALPLLSGPSRIRLLSPLESAPYVDMTLAVLREFGVFAERLTDGYDVPGNQRYLRVPYAVEGDYSQAAFWLAARHLGSDLEVLGLEPASFQGDRAILGLLRAYREAAGAPGAGSRDLVLDASQIPDLVPILAVVAAYHPGRTRIEKAARLRLKESDRLSAIRDALAAIGAEIRETEDGLVVEGGRPLRGGVVDTRQDHRIAMAMAVAALGTREGVVLRDPGCVAKSYPDFFDEWRRLGGSLHGINLG